MTIVQEKSKTKATKADAPRRAYTINEFVAAFRISRATVYRLIRNGSLRATLLAGRRVIPVDAAEALLAGATPLKDIAINTNRQQKAKAKSEAA